MFNIFKKKADEIQASYWFGFIVILNNLIQFFRDTVKYDFSTALDSLNWIDMIVKILLALSIIHVFRKHKSNTDEINSIRDGYLQQREKLSDIIHLSSLVNILRLKSSIEQTKTYYDQDFAAYEFNLQLKNEKQWLKENLTLLRPDKTGGEIDRLLNEYYQIEFQTSQKKE